MENILIFFLFSVFLFGHIQSESFNLLKYYENSVDALISDGLKDTKYCQSILLPTEHILKKTLDSTFVKSKSGAVLSEVNRIDLCCRSLYKCNAHKYNELNQTTAWNSGIRHCECVNSFKICLKSLNTSLSNKFDFIHSINTTKCSSNDHPIIKCTAFEKYSDKLLQLSKTINSNNREKYFKRCIKYESDQNREKQFQIFDMPFNENEMFTTRVFLLKDRQSVLKGMIVDSKIMDELDKLDTNQKFKTEKEAAKFVFKVMQIVSSIGCEVLDTFFEDMGSGIEEVKNHYDEEELEGGYTKVQFAMKVTEILIKVACENLNIINAGSSKPQPLPFPFNFYAGSNPSININCPLN
ncbi:uncharacterized protein LOC129579678 [Sitodiplosis mosellana]|uniref:uncharacterized protein LOC129575810 n=1 Tax=Sitodiplosis mosellana TaxID=263140 RepID=UPI0024447604|nr:uncharacterized protein LOC129575810 [Sitodiplosis mosellana]XP_055325818.1 uncharacterized protein LOC129579678 [Sitodiplosis mosellana]